MKVYLVLIFLVSIQTSFCQIEEKKSWEISTSISVGSENNIGNPGFMLTSECEYFFFKAFSVSTKVGFFHSVTSNTSSFPNTDFLSNFSALTGGLYINHTNRFSKNYVRVSAGGAYFHSDAFYQSGSSTQVTSHIQVVSKLGYGLSLEGGREVSDKISLGLILQIYSYQIFGDISTIGVNTHFKL
ncbi:MAG: hypothetical protein JNJ65_01650 [Cyclobacteriaceae bacterium]|jgi:hypothetical protein|nr:hypothetical protein [Cyclobacteriaceae bacterium]